MSRAFGMRHQSTLHNQRVIFFGSVIDTEDYFDLLSLPILGDFFNHVRQF